MTHRENNQEWLSSRVAALEKTRAELLRLLSLMRDEMLNAGMEIPSDVDNALKLKKNDTFDAFVSQVFRAPHDKSGKS